MAATSALSTSQKDWKSCLPTNLTKEVLKYVRPYKHQAQELVEAGIIPDTNGFNTFPKKLRLSGAGQTAQNHFTGLDINGLYIRRDGILPRRLLCTISLTTIRTNPKLDRFATSIQAMLGVTGPSTFCLVQPLRSGSFSVGTGDVYTEVVGGCS